METRNISLNDFFTNSFVITIDEERYNLFLEFFKNSFNSEVLPKKFVGFQDKSLSGPMNCTKSHFVIINYAKQKKLPFVVIFEDDAYPCIDCEKKLNDIISNIPQNINFLLFGWSEFSFNNKQNFDNTFNKIETIFAGSHAYIIFADGYDDYLNFIKSEPDSTADGLVFKKIKNSYTIKYPLFIQVNYNESMNSHIGYIYNGDNDTPPKGFDYFKTIYIFSNASPYLNSDLYASKLENFNYNKNSSFVFLNMAIPYFTNMEFFNSCNNEKIIIHRGAFYRDTGIWKEYFGEDKIKPYLENFQEQYLLNYELMFSKQTIINAKNGNEVPYHFENLTYPKNQIPTTGFLAYYMFKHLYPNANIKLVNFLGKENNFTPKANCHEWNYEYNYFNLYKHLKINI